jgi:L-threonylcarbamoyladenylate synthase
MVGAERQRLSECTRPSDILDCAAVVRRGGVIIFPTDTVYGIGCDPFNELAVKRIFEIKNREKNKPLPVLAATVDRVGKIARMDTVARTLARRYWPGRLTIVCPLQDRRISSLVSANSGKIAVRIPGNKCTLKLLKECTYLTGTSANRSGEDSMREIWQIISSRLEGIDRVLSGGSLTDSIESTVIDVCNQMHPIILRSGAVASDEIFETLRREGLIDKPF